MSLNSFKKQLDGTIINDNKSDYDRYILQRKVLSTKQINIDSLREEIMNLENRIKYVEDCLTKVLKKVN